MTQSFKDYNFEIINVNTLGELEMVVNFTGLYFSAHVVNQMGNVDFVRSLIDVNSKAFAIQSCTAKGPRAMKFSNTKSKKGEVMYLHVARLEVFCK